jgi:hypothetical protein
VRLIVVTGLGELTASRGGASYSVQPPRESWCASLMLDFIGHSTKSQRTPERLA